jgi:hypothetical protein
MSVGCGNFSVECGTDAGDVVIHENLLKTVHTAEIFEAVIVSASHVSRVNHLEDDVAEVVSGVDTPVGEHKRAEHSEGLEPEEADAFEQFCAGDVAGFFGARVASELLLGVAKSGIDEAEGRWMVGTGRSAAERFHRDLTHQSGTTAAGSEGQESASGDAVYERMIIRGNSGMKRVF